MYNEAYRKGDPLISDGEYDELVEALRSLDPHHPYLHAVEPEALKGTQIRHPTPMLSIDKAYHIETLQRFLDRVSKAADDLGLEALVYTATPKLDGLAGRDDGVYFASRGDGLVGFEISSAFDKGVVPVGGRGQGLGEIVVVQSYFDDHMAGKFEHPRNMVVGIVSSDKVNEAASQALRDGMVRFVPYSMLPNWTGNADELLSDLEGATEWITVQTDYPMDGIVVSATDERIRAYMGATAHHYRWQIAVKTKGDTAQTVIHDIEWQVSRTGNVTPVLIVEPIFLSGATIRRVTGHNAGLVKKNRIGAGAEIEVIRSGEVIPKLERVIQPAEAVSIPGECPSCHSDLVWERDFLKCTDPNCRAQAAQRISHWFKTLGNADWFGIKTVEKLVNHGHDTLEKVYAMSEKAFLDLGFGPVQSRNLAEAIDGSIHTPVEDWRFLAAFGIPDLGTADSRSLLSRFRLAAVTDLTAEDIRTVAGFGPITSESIARSIQRVARRLTHMLDLGFSLTESPLLQEEPADPTGLPLAAKRLIFTGKMQHGSRSDMQSEARQLGAVIQTSVTAKTDFLICGEKVGESKLRKAEQLGVSVLSEDEYLRMIDAL